MRNLPLERRWLLDSGKTEGLSGNLDDVAFQGDWLIWHRRAWRPIRGTKPVIRVSSAHLPAARETIQLLEDQPGPVALGWSGEIAKSDTGCVVWPAQCQVCRGNR